MRKNTTTKRDSAPVTPQTSTSGLTRGQVEEIVDEMLRTAFRDHSREMEKHLRNIHDRLVAIETHGALR